MHMLCSCTSALKTHSNFFNELLGVLHFQMQMIPDDFFEDVLASNNFLATTLSLLFMNIEGISSLSVHHYSIF
jgi:A1 cistron-splicing factor AAR2